MGREIKFRGRKNSTKEWIYGSLISDKNGGYAIIQIGDNPISNGVVSGWCFGIEKGTESQYTGLKDKNGKEIYEGDIMQHSNPFDIPFLVNWIDSECGYGFNYGSTSYVITDPSFTVIGNVFENPELLDVVGS